MSETKVVHKSSVSILGLLGVMFVAFKLLGITAVASWSWWWVTAPFWGGIALAFSVWALLAVFVVVVALLSK